MDAREVIARAAHDTHLKAEGKPAMSDDSWNALWPSRLFQRSVGEMAEAILAALAANQLAVVGRGMALSDVAGERQRQAEVEGWNADHDDKHTRGQLARAAAAYAFQSTVSPEERSNSDNNDKAWCLWPWARKWWKPIDRRRNLVKAGALIIAEIERLDRISPSPLSTGDRR